MKTILVPTDFSKAAKNAAEYAVKLAEKINAQVLLFHVFHVPIDTTDFPVNIISPMDLQKENEALLKKEIAKLKKNKKVSINFLVKNGLPVDEIIEEEKNVFMIIMGMTGASKMSEILIGSTTTTVIRKSKKPVFVIPEKAKYKHIEKIVFAYDYDARTNTKTLDTLKELSKTFRSKIYVVNVIHNEESITAEELTAGKKLEHKLKDVEHVYFFPENEDLVDGINEFVNLYHADIVTMIPHRHNMIERLFHRSITKKMAFHTHVPLLTLPDNHKILPVYIDPTPSLVEYQYQKNQTFFK